MNTNSLVAEPVNLPAAAAPQASAAQAAAPAPMPVEFPETVASCDAMPAAEAPAIEALAAQVPAAEAPVAQASAPAAPVVAQSARALLKQFQQQFPAFRNCLPLAIGIDKQLLARIPDLERKAMRTALGIHTGSLRYLRAMEKATVRYDLDGIAGAEVTDTHRSHAKETLQQRFKKEADRKKAERDATQAAEADRLRQEKLVQLASKFSRNG